jgi:aryl-alcohol dehydrogenase-like predicted oxidoreductase
VPWAESVGALEELRQEGKVRMVGVSNADPDQIRQAQAITQLASVQNELSPRFRSSEPELELCTAEGIAFLPWSPLGGIGSAADLGSAHTAFAEVARARGVSPQQVCLAWLLAKSPVVVPIPGARRVESILDSVAAAELELTTRAELAEPGRRLVPVVLGDDAEHALLAVDAAGQGGVLGGRAVRDVEAHGEAALDARVGVARGRRRRAHRAGRRRPA